MSTVHNGSDEPLVGTKYFTWHIIMAYHGFAKGAVSHILAHGLIVQLSGRSQSLTEAPVFYAARQKAIGRVDESQCLEGRDSPVLAKNSNIKQPGKRASHLESPCSGCFSPKRKPTAEALNPDTRWKPTCNLGCGSKAATPC